MFILLHYNPKKEDGKLLQKCILKYNFLKCLIYVLAEKMKVKINQVHARLRDLVNATTYKIRLGLSVSNNIKCYM